MSCCGKFRAQTTWNGTALPASVPVDKPLYGTVLFEYTGRTGLTVVGPVSRTTYHFGGPGSRVYVDGRDSIPLGLVRTLRRV